ncbi:MAG: hypothetical protein AAFY99_11125 [Pseudomonadota bacterium]
MTMNYLKKNRFALAALATIVLATTGIASAEAKNRDRDGGAARFEQMDANNDGQVTFAEFQTLMLERFAEVDTDDDNLVTQAEIEEVADGRRGGRMVRGLIAMFDINQDEQVSLEELNNRQQKLFALADFDDSGFITEDELPRERFAGMRGKRGNR